MALDQRVPQADFPPHLHSRLAAPTHMEAAGGNGSTAGVAGADVAMASLSEQLPGGDLTSLGGQALTQLSMSPADQHHQLQQRQQQQHQQHQQQQPQVFLPKPSNRSPPPITVQSVLPSTSPPVNGQGSGSTLTNSANLIHMGGLLQNAGKMGGSAQAVASSGMDGHQNLVEAFTLMQAREGGGSLASLAFASSLDGEGAGWSQSRIKEEADRQAGVGNIPPNISPSLWAVVEGFVARNSNTNGNASQNSWPLLAGMSDPFNEATADRMARNMDATHPIEAPNMHSREGARNFDKNN
eukprot:TRINITY_DN3653_c0_g3_i1.p1 TRINITY_DN3653_c0_g3~~TRINITY_DN3653_c0_g3_i1.p1  ORF type:complete len:327 (-),score=30.96 TRINITY_DN3653_c0_g3_i1:147-1037(-)